jgi:hypothetical protein
LANKLCVLTLLLALGAPGAPLRAELLKLSLLAKPARAFTLKLDVFQGRGPGDQENVSPGAAAATGPAQAEKLQKSIAEEIQQSVSYEGFIVKNARKSALLNVSGQFPCRLPGCLSIRSGEGWRNHRSRKTVQWKDCLGIGLGSLQGSTTHLLGSKRTA